MNRTLDYVPRLVEANRAYRVSAPDPALLQMSRYWTPGYPVLDQGAEGACVGFGCTGEAMASPVRGKFDNPNDAASHLYWDAKGVDEWEGVDYEGTSVRAGMLVGRERGWWGSFGWAFNLAELRAALELGPVVVGVSWLEQMYEAPGGVVTVGGREVGGHCLLVTGYTRYHRVLKEPAYRWRNSWGESYGALGSAYVSADDLDRVLFQAGGEAAVVTGRAL